MVEFREKVVTKLIDWMAASLMPLVQGTANESLCHRIKTDPVMRAKVEEVYKEMIDYFEEAANKDGVIVAELVLEEMFRPGLANKYSQGLRRIFIENIVSM